MRLLSFLLYSRWYYLNSQQNCFNPIIFLSLTLRLKQGIQLSYQTLIQKFLTTQNYCLEFRHLHQTLIGINTAIKFPVQIYHVSNANQFFRRQSTEKNVFNIITYQYLTNFAWIQKLLLFHYLQWFQLKWTFWLIFFDYEVIWFLVD